MSSCAANGRLAASALTLTILLLCAGCNLGAAPDQAPALVAGPPTIHIAAPLPNQSFLVGTRVSLQARVENAGDDVSRIRILLDEALLGEKLYPNETGAPVLPLTIDWLASAPGRFNLSVIAERADGSSARADVGIDVIARDSPAAAVPSPLASDEAAGDIAGLAVEASAPASEAEVNLIVSAVDIAPNPPICGGTTMIDATIINTGGRDASSVGLIGWEILLDSTGEVIESDAAAVIQSLGAGEETTVSITETLTTGPGLAQRVRVTIDSGDMIVESDDSDNAMTSAGFTLAPGDCAG